MSVVTKDKDNLDNIISCTKVKGMAVFAVEEGQNVGFVKSVLMELEDKKSLVFLIEDNEWYKGAKVLKAGDVMKIGQEAVVIEAVDKLTNFSEMPEGSVSVTRSDTCSGKIVVDEQDDKLGKVKGCLIDRGSVEMRGVVIEAEDGQEQQIPSEQIVEVKKDVVVVSQELVAEKTDEKANGESREDDLEPDTLIERNVSLGNVTKLEHPKVAEEEHVQKAGPVEQKSLKDILEERQDKFLLGKRVDRDILTDDGSLIIKKEEVITAQALKQAKDAHKYIVLSFCIKRN